MSVNNPRPRDLEEVEQQNLWLNHHRDPSDQPAVIHSMSPIGNLCMNKCANCRKKTNDCGEKQTVVSLTWKVRKRKNFNSFMIVRNN